MKICISKKPLKVLYFDMDGVLVNFQSGIDAFSPAVLSEYKGKLDTIPGIFLKMTPMPGALAAYRQLTQYFDVYILSTAPWHNPSAWSDKLLWVKQYLGDSATKRLILSHNKHLNAGDFLIDDRIENGADRFTGELIRFGSADFPNWNTIVTYLKKRV